MDTYSLHMDTSTYPADVSRVVVAAIEAAGQTQLGVAEATGIPRTTLIRRLKGSPFTVAELAAIADCLGVSVTDLLNTEVAA